MIDGSWSPIARNTIALIAQIRICHAPRPSSRASGERTRAARRPVISPATTVASTPDSPNCSAKRYAVAGAISVTATSSSGSPVRRNRAVMTMPIMAPTSTPPIPMIRKSTLEPSGENVISPSAAADAARYAVSEVASLMRLSPSRIVTIRRGTPSRWKIDVAATASGGATIAPRVSAAARPMPGIMAFATRPTASVVNSTRPTARRRIGRAFARKSRIGVKYAAANRMGGRNRAKTRSGWSSMRGRPGTRPRATPARSSRIGSAMRSRRAT